jgi:hypothetical protein
LIKENLEPEKMFSISHLDLQQQRFHPKILKIKKMINTRHEGIKKKRKEYRELGNSYTPTLLSVASAPPARFLRPSFLNAGATLSP